VTGTRISAIAVCGETAGIMGNVLDMANVRVLVFKIIIIIFFFAFSGSGDFKIAAVWKEGLMYSL